MPVDDFVQYEFPTATDLNMFPRGVLGVTVATNTAYTNATGSYTAVSASAGTAPSLTLTLSTSRKYRASFHGRFDNASGGYVLVGFHEAATLRNAVQFFAATGALTMGAEWIFTPNSGASVTYDIRVALNGSGTINATANAQYPMVFLIEDLGIV